MNHKENLKRIAGTKKFRIAISGFLALMIIFSFNSPYNSQIDEDRKVAVIVLDGADFEVLDKLKEEDEISNIQKLEEDGLSTVYKTPDAFSPQTWTKMGTGMSTENISLERSWTYESDDGHQRRLDSRAIEHRRFWSYLSEAGVEVGVYHWVMTWPIEPVNGFMVSGFLTADLNQMTYPSDIAISDDEAKSSLVLFNTFDVANTLIDEYYGMDVKVYGFQVSDRLQHSFWKYLDDDNSENEEFRELMYKPYYEVDEMIGELRPEYTVILVSDHGFEEAWAETYQADINDLLEDIGLTSFSIKEEGMARSLEFASNATIAHRPHENQVNDPANYGVRFEVLDEDVNPQKVIRELAKLRYSEDREFLTELEYENGYIEGVMHLDEGYMSDEYLDERHMRLSYARGDLPILQQDLHVRYEDEEYISELGPKQTGDHPKNTNGVFYIAGEGIKEEGRTNIDIKAEDLTPLILQLKGVDIPEDMDGEVPMQIFDAQYRMLNRPSYGSQEVKVEEFNRDIERGQSQEDRISERLEELGYLR